MKRDDSFRTGLRIGVGFALPGFVLAVSFGVLARDLGWGVLAPIVASIVYEWSAPANVSAGDLMPGITGTAASLTAKSVYTSSIWRVSASASS